MRFSGETVSDGLHSLIIDETFAPGPVAGGLQCQHSRDFPAESVVAESRNLTIVRLAIGSRCAAT